MENIERSAAELWSDFDGTGIHLMKKHDPRNWTKYPVRMIDGYLEFLEGVQRGGVEVAGIVSRRGRVRSGVTQRSIAQLGMSGFFGQPGQVVLAGSETAKAQHVANRARLRPVGVLEDKPHNLGLELTKIIGSWHEGGPRLGITLGAIDHPKRDEYLDRLATLATATAQASGVEVESAGSSLCIVAAAAELRVVPVEPYSALAGEIFARQLCSAPQV